MIESFWLCMQVELLDRKPWRTRVELANAIFEYLEIVHNRPRRHSSLGMLTPIEYENKPTEVAREPSNQALLKRGTPDFSTNSARFRSGLLGLRYRLPSSGCPHTQWTMRRPWGRRSGRSLFVDRITEHGSGPKGQIEVQGDTLLGNGPATPR
jgi:Integrase core domain